MRARIMNHEHVAILDFGQRTVNREFVVVLAQAPHHVIHVVARRVFLARHGNMVIGAIQRWTHEVRCTRIDADIFLVNMLVMDGRGNQATVWAHHKAAHFRENRYITHASRHENLLIHAANAFTNRLNIVRLLAGLVRNAHAARQVDELNVRARLLLQLNSQLEQHGGELGVIVVRHGIAAQEGMDAEMLGALGLERAERLEQLLGRHAILGIARVVHNAVRNFEKATGVITAADGFWNAANRLFEEVDVRNIVEVDNGTQLRSRLVVGCGGFIRREHNVVARDAHSIAKLQLSCRRTVASAPVIAQDIDKERVRRGLYRKVFLEAWVPRERVAHRLHVSTNARLVIEMERRGVMLDDLIELSLRNEGLLVHARRLSQNLRGPAGKGAPSRAA